MQLKSFLAPCHMDLQQKTGICLMIFACIVYMYQTYTILVNQSVLQTYNKLLSLFERKQIVPQRNSKKRTFEHGVIPYLKTSTNCQGSRSGFSVSIHKNMEIAVLMSLSACLSSRH